MSIQDMNNRVKQNSALRPSKRRKFKERGREAIYAQKTATSAPEFRPVSDMEVNRAKRRFRKRARLDSTKNRNTDIFLLIVGFIIFLILLYRLN